MTERLRPLIANVDFQSKGKTIARTTQYAGYVGVITGMKPVSTK